MRYIFLLIFCIAAAACEPEATPFPANIPATQQQIIQPPTAPPPIRYALAENTQGFVKDIEQIESAGLLVQLTTSGDAEGLGTEYDIVAAYGLWPDWTPVPVVSHIALVLNTNLYPLDSPEITAIIEQILNTGEIVEDIGIPGAMAELFTPEQPRIIRTQLANLGWPDGFELTLAADNIIGIQQIVRQFATVQVDVRATNYAQDDILAALDDNRVHMALISWLSRDERKRWSATHTMIDLYTLPISYKAIPELEIEFTETGWPLATR